jgi:hypothetical protein
MGTNYYLIGDTCPHCGRGEDRKHIGKSSAGWCFALHVDGDIKSLADWQSLWSKPGAKIEDEYGSGLTPELMLSYITERSWKGAAPRHQPIDGHHVIGHGDGTYDLMVGDFS